MPLSTRRTRPVPTLARTSSPRGIISLATATFDQIGKSSPAGKMCAPYHTPHVGPPQPISSLALRLLTVRSTFHLSSTFFHSLFLPPTPRCSHVSATLGSSLCWICRLSRFFPSLTNIFLSCFVLIFGLWVVRVRKRDFKEILDDQSDH